MVDLTSSALELEGKPAYHLVLRELNERARLEQQLREAEKLSALGQLASGIAHEVNNPLAIMNAHLELILDPSRLRRPDARRHSKGHQGSAAAPPRSSAISWPSPAKSIRTCSPLI